MAITPLWRAGAEMQHANEVDISTGIGGNLSPGISSVKSKTGTYSFSSTNGYPFGKNITSTTQIRAGVFLNHAGALSANSRCSILGVLTGLATPFCRVQWNGSGTPAIELIVNNVSVATIPVTSSGMSSFNTWYHCGITYKSSATVGVFSFYVDGVQKLTWTGNTGTAVTAVYAAGGLGTGDAGWSPTAYWDDFYVDDTVGEADAAPTSITLPFLLVNGAGTSAAWGVYGVASNYLAVDETGVPNDLTDFVFGTSSGLNDKYAVTNTTAGVTVPSGQSIAAVILVDWAQRTDAGSASTLKLGSLLSGTTVLGSAQTLLVGSFGMIQERQATKPGGGGWSTTDVDSMEFVHETAGTF